MRLVGDTGGEEQLVAASAVYRAIAELQRPQTVNGERVPFRIYELTVEITFRVERVDPSVAEISH